ncbi:HIRAN domain-containing protein [Nonomuraea sp. NPDC049419]|uniref:HIRAN domain-containing protein n=1 Tax=Nonomuraea sp. NPDC049419 TaxID=3155772 RepID=UPI0034367DBE
MAGWKPVVKSSGGQRESEGIVVPLIGVQHNAPGGKGPHFDHACGEGKHQGMTQDGGLIAVLVPEAPVLSGSNAVAVYVQDGHVGYLPSEVAARVGPRIRAFGSSQGGRFISCPARIHLHPPQLAGVNVEARRKLGAWRSSESNLRFIIDQFAEAGDPTMGEACSLLAQTLRYQPGRRDETLIAYVDALYYRRLDADLWRDLIDYASPAPHIPMLTELFAISPSPVRPALLPLLVSISDGRDRMGHLDPAKGPRLRAAAPMRKPPTGSQRGSSSRARTQRQRRFSGRHLHVPPTGSPFDSALINDSLAARGRPTKN